MFTIRVELKMLYLLFHLSWQSVLNTLLETISYPNISIGSYITWHWQTRAYVGRPCTTDML